MNNNNNNNTNNNIDFYNNYYIKVFNNLYLKNLIYKFVCFKDYNYNNNSLNYNNFNKINNSYKIQDITNFEKLIKIGSQSLFDDFFEFYFYTVIYNQSKYWYFNFYRNGHHLSEIDLYHILRYKELGFQRFQLIYENFKQSFKSNNKFILKNAAAGGNFEIYEFLKYQENFENLKMIDNIYPFDDIITVMDSIFTIQETCSGNRSSSINCYFECGNNFEIFIDLYNYYKLHSHRIINTILITWLIENNLIQESIYLLNQLSSSGFIDNEYYLLVGTSLKFGCIELANYLINFNNDGESLFNKFFKNDECLKNIRIIYDYVNSNNYQVTPYIIHMNVFQLYWDRFIELQIQKKLDYYPNKSKFLENINLIGFNFQIVNYDKNIIYNQIYQFHYYPNLQEFKYLIEKDQQLLKKLGIKFLDKLIINLTTNPISSKSSKEGEVIFDYEYINYILKFLNSNNCKLLLFKNYNNYTIPTSCFDTNFEMIEYLFKNYEIFIPNDSNSIVLPNLNSFNGDIKSVKFIHSFSINGIYKNKFYNLENSVLEQSIKNGHFEILNYLLLNLKKDKKQQQPLQIYQIYNDKDYNKSINQFKIFQIITKFENENCGGTSSTSSFSFNWINNETNILNLFKLLKPIYIHWLFNNNIFNLKNKLIESTSISTSILIKYSISNLQLFKLFFSIFPNQFQNSDNLIYIYKNSKSYSILEWYFNNCKIKPSQFSEWYFNDDYYKNSSGDSIQLKLIKSFIKRNELTKFSILIENDHLFIHLNLNEIIKISTKFKNSIILNSILQNNSINHHDDTLLYDEDFKLLLFVKTIIYSVSNISNQLKQDDENEDYLWMFNLNLINLSKPKLKLLGKNLTINKQQPHQQQQECFLTINQLNSINYNYYNYFEPNLKNLKKKCSNVILICQFIIGLNK